MNNKTVVVGMSGGVDSSVAAVLLKEQGFNVIGIFMKNWEETDENGQCQSAKEYEDVVAVCEKLEIPYYSIDFVKEYQNNVFKYFLEEYQKGYTPNPDILCNREIKFKVFFEKAMEFGANFLATGHYANNPVIEGKNLLAKGKDKGKDQSYFLYTLKSSLLKNILFPLGNLEKSQVREIAAKYNLSTQNKKDSTGICFIGERNFKNFLSQYISKNQGNFETLTGEIVGKHQGACFYTIGQRKGLGLGGPGEPWFVVGKDINRNIVFVVRGVRHPALYAQELWANEISWVDEQFDPSLPLRCKAKIRYRQQDQDCTLISINFGEIYVVFDFPQRAIAPRQSLVFYQNQICLGGATIIGPGPTFYQMNKSLPEIIAD